MDPTALPEIDVGLLEDLLSEATGTPVRIVSARELGASSRETPWRIDVETQSGPHSWLLRSGDSTRPNEVAALEAMASHPIPTPGVVLWDETGSILGTPVFVSEFIDGDPLLPAMVAGEEWAIDLYVDTACDLQAIAPDDLPPGTADLLQVETIQQVIGAAFDRFELRTVLHEQAHDILIATQPQLPDPAFSNGDLWPENILIRDRQVVGVIDWQHAGWSDPIFEFLLPFFLVPDLRGRGIEEGYVERKGCDRSVLDWYRGVEIFDSLAWVLHLGEPYEIHTAETLTEDLDRWVQENG